MDEILNEILRSHWVNKKEIAGILWKPLFEVMIPLILWDIPLVTLYTGWMFHHSFKATMGHPIDHFIYRWVSHNGTKATMGHPIGHFMYRWDVPSELQGCCETSHWSLYT